MKKYFLGFLLLLISCNKINITQKRELISCPLSKELLRPTKIPIKTPRDYDRDGILNEDDSCPMVFGYIEYHGCPIPPVVIPPKINPTYVALIDFDGQAINSSVWNGSQPFIAAPSTMNATQIQQALDIVKNWYKDFNILITTDENTYYSFSTTHRQRVVVTSSSSWFGSGSSGVAYKGQMKWGDDDPAFSFSSLMGDNPLYVGLSICHELGHTANLAHKSLWSADCLTLTEYAPGYIMGDFFKGASWGYGQTPFGCSTYQNDTLEINKFLQ